MKTSTLSLWLNFIVSIYPEQGGKKQQYSFKGKNVYNEVYTISIQIPYPKTTRHRLALFLNFSQTIAVMYVKSKYIHSNLYIENLLQICFLYIVRITRCCHLIYTIIDGIKALCFISYGFSYSLTESKDRKFPLLMFFRMTLLYLE